MITLKIFKGNIFTLGILALIFAVLLTACGPAVLPSPAPTLTPAVTSEPIAAEVPADDLSGQLVGPLWMLLGYGDAGNPTIVEPGTNVTAQFEKDNSLIGFGGCNSFFGPYDLTGEEIQISARFDNADK